MSKHLLLEIEVSDKGQENAQEVAYIIEDALTWHIRLCTNGESEQSFFVSGAPKFKVLTED